MTAPIPVVIESSLCTRCGCCAAVCPQDCIIMKSTPPAQKGETCINCGLCEQVCPGRGIDLQSHGASLCDTARYHRGMGWIINSYSAYATEEKIRKAATSGGVVTSMLKYLLEADIIDGALVVTFDADQPWITRYILATSTEEVEQSAQTKYQITSLEDSLHKIPQNRIAVVGLPCMMHGMRKLQKTPVGKKIVLLIGLFCWVHMEQEATAFLLRALNIKASDVKDIAYRSGEYLGGFRVRDIHGHKKFLEKECYNFLPLLYAPERCTVCADFSNELADISCGDAKSLKSPQGHTYVITRSQLGQDVLDDCVEHGVIQVNACPIEEIMDSEGSALLFKKGAFKRIEKKGIPIFYGIEQYTIPLKNKIYECIFCFIHARRRYFRKIIEFLPGAFFNLISRWITRQRGR